MKRFPFPLGFTAALAVATTLPAEENSTMSTEAFVHFGQMHEAIGQQQHQGRVVLSELLTTPHFYGVGAAEGLTGEITIDNGVAVVTVVDPNGMLAPKADKKGDVLKATLLAGGYISSWQEHRTENDVSPVDFDASIAKFATASGVDTANPFVFVVEGEFRDLRLHVINGACPVHARIHKVELPKDKSPAELDFKSIRGKLVGVYARDAVGKLTHPATSTHTHVVFTDERTGKKMTGHVERVGLVAGAVVRIPGSAKDSTQR